MEKLDYLIIMAKEAVPGKVKTRMVPPLSSKAASRLYRCLLLDTIDMVRKVRRVQRGVAYSPSSSQAYFKDIVPRGFLLVPQPDGGLGERLNGIFKIFFREGAGKVCLINSDGPDLPPAYIERAFEMMKKDQADVVFGPNPDGGYYLVGLSRPADIFEHIPWSTRKVLEKSLERAGTRELRSALLPPWPDLDTFEDLLKSLQRWRKGGKIPPRKTYAYANDLLSGEDTQEQ